MAAAGACKSDQVTDLLNQLEKKILGCLLLILLTSIIKFRNKKIKCHFNCNDNISLSFEITRSCL